MDYYALCLRTFFSSSSFLAPTILSISLPFFTSTKVGIPVTLNSLATSWKHWNCSMFLNLYSHNKNTNECGGIHLKQLDWSADVPYQKIYIYQTQKQWILKVNSSNGGYKCTETAESWNLGLILQYNNNKMQ